MIGDEKDLDVAVEEVVDAHLLDDSSTLTIAADWIASSSENEDDVFLKCWRNILSFLVI